jgi:hypothetical protein
MVPARKKSRTMEHRPAGEPDPSRTDKIVARHNRVVIESGRQKVFASALDWPGWSRSGRTEQAAIAALEDYLPRYLGVTARAEVKGVRAAAGELAAVEHLQGGGATDFGVPDRVATIERQGLTKAELERHLKLLQACWAEFDETAARVSATLQKGPRGGGRDRDEIIEHVYEAERGYVRHLGIPRAAAFDYTGDGLATHRAAVLGALRGIHKAGDTSSTWPYPYVIRRMAWHLLDHAWELQDKDLS